MVPIPEDLDPAVPALGTLLGEDAGGLLAAVFDGVGARLLRHSVSQVRYVPGRSVTVHYRADVAWGSAKPARELLVATSGIAVPDGTPVFAAGGVEIAVWRFPNDPFLPGLPVVSDPASAADLLGQLGAPGDVAGVRTRAYRAGRRAVVELTTPDVSVYVKVVRPQRAARLQANHTRLAAALAVPHSYGWSGEYGLVALQAMPGRTLRAALEAHSTRVPDPEDLVALLDRFPEPDADAQVVAGPRSRAAEHGRLLAGVAPDLARRIEAVVEALQADADPPAVAVHGDFHSSQVLIEGARIVGLVDVDTAGAGSRIDDLASMLGHLATLGTTSAAARDLGRYGARLIAAFDRLVDPVELRLRTAAAVFGLATGPFRVQLPRWRAETEQRVALAEAWIRSARRAADSL